MPPVSPTGVLVDMEIEAFAPGEYDEALATEVTDVLAAAWAVDCPHEPLPPMRSNLLRLRHGWEGYGPDRVFQGYDAGRVVGHATVDLSHWDDNQDLAWLEITVLPEWRGRGVGSALHDACVGFAVEQGKTQLMGGTWMGSASDTFAERKGYTIGQHDVERRLDLVTFDLDRIDKLHAEASRRAEGYELIRVAGAAPEELVPTLVEVTAAINDAPKDDLDFEDDVYSPERIRSFGAAQSAREHRVYRVLARSLDDDSWAGQTLVAVDGNQPQHSEQLDTTVVVRHRGHRLGLLLKTEMLRWVRGAEPQVTQIDTWNSASNTHMIAVNDALGCEVVGHNLIWQRRRAVQAAAPVGAGASGTKGG